MNKENLNNLFSLYAAIEKINPGTSILDFDEFQIVKTDNSVWPNIAFGIKEDEISAAVINAIEGEMQKVNMHPLVICSDNPCCLANFKRQKFRPIQQWHAMYLDELGNQNNRKTSNQFDLNLLKDTDIISWTSLVSEVLFKSDYLDPGIFNFLAQDGAELVGLKIGSQLVGSAMIYYDNDGYAGIYMVAIQPEFRRQGLGKLIIIFCLDQIKGNKRDKCFLQSTGAGIPLYNSLNFKKSGNYFLYWKM